MCVINWVLLLDFIKVLLSWPPVIGVLAITFFVMFREKIGSFIDDVEELGMGGAKVQRQVSIPLPELKLPGATDADAVPVPPQAGVQQPGPPNRTVSQESRDLMGPDFNFEPAIDFMLQEPGRAIDEFIEQAFIANSERAFANIFGTQVQALEYLNNVGMPVPMPDILPFFQAHLERGKHLTEPHNIESFTGFLENVGFIKNVGASDGPLLQITPRGKRFLAYIKQFYPNTWNTQSL